MGSPETPFLSFALVRFFRLMRQSNIFYIFHLYPVIASTLVLVFLLYLNLISITSNKQEECIDDWCLFQCELFVNHRFILVTKVKLRKKIVTRIPGQVVHEGQSNFRSTELYSCFESE